MLAGVLPKICVLETHKLATSLGFTPSLHKGVNLAQRRSYQTNLTTDSSGIEEKILTRIRDSLLELESALLPLLVDKYRVLMSKENKITDITMIENKKSKINERLILTGVKTYVLTSSYLTAIETSRTFKRYFNLRLSLPELKENLIDPKLIKEQAKIVTTNEKLLGKVASSILNIHTIIQKAETSEIKAYDNSPWNTRLVDPDPLILRDKIIIREN